MFSFFNFIYIILKNNVMKFIFFLSLLKHYFFFDYELLVHEIFSQYHYYYHFKRNRLIKTTKIKK